MLVYVDPLHVKNEKKVSRTSFTSRKGSEECFRAFLVRPGLPNDFRRLTNEKQSTSSKEEK